jgi:hypothetical protein
MELLDRDHFFSMFQHNKVVCMSIHYFFQTNGVARFRGLNFVSFNYLEKTINV